MSERTEWLTERVNKTREQYKSCESDAMAYQYAAEAETYERIKNGTLPFGTPREALEVYERNADQPDYGMTAGRIRAIEKYLEFQE